jgi:F0F1-type ATP synthase assembly protein I
MERDPDKRYRYMRLVSTMGTLPLMLGAAPTLGFFAGRWLDGKMGTTPWMQFVFLVLGFGAAARYTYRVLQGVRKDMDRL